jgi:hypothetical protein
MSDQSAEHYRKQAAEAEKQAKLAWNELDCDSWLRLAQERTRLAESAESRQRRGG